MAYDKTPTAWIAGVEYKAAGAAVTANSLVIPLTSIPKGLTQAEIEGDIVKIIYSVVDAFAKAYAEKGDDVPTKMTVSSGQGYGTATGNESMSFGFQVAVSALTTEVQEEPT